MRTTRIKKMAAAAAALRRECASGRTLFYGDDHLFGGIPLYLGNDRLHIKQEKTPAIVLQKLLVMLRKKLRVMTDKLLDYQIHIQLSIYNKLILLIRRNL